MRYNFAINKFVAQKCGKLRELNDVYFFFSSNLLPLFNFIFCRNFFFFGVAFAAVVTAFMIAVVLLLLLLLLSFNHKGLNVNLEFCTCQCLDTLCTYLHF